MVVSPFYLNTFDANQDSGISAEQQPIGIGDPVAEMVAFPSHRPSSTPPTVFPHPGPVVPAPVGLSGKEIARLRAQTLGSQQSQAQTRSTLDVSQPETRSSANLNAATEPGEASSSDDTRRLHSEVESLRREMERLRDMERLRTEGLVTEAGPPSYSTEGHR